MPGTAVRATGIVCAAVWMLAATAGLAQNSSAADERSGVSRPDPTPITIDADDATPAASVAPAKPSAAVPAASTSETVYGPYVPYKGPATAASSKDTTNAKAFDPDANIVTEATAGQADRRVLGKANADDGIVTYVPSRSGEIPEGTLVKARLREALSTLTTQPGTKFTAEVCEPVMRDGKVIVPIGSMMEGRVTWVRGGKRVGGAAAIHLEPRTVTLPDGAQYVLRARAIDTDRWDTTNVDSEGTILKKDHGKRTAATITLSGWQRYGRGRDYGRTSRRSDWRGSRRWCQHGGVAEAGSSGGTTEEPGRGIQPDRTDERDAGECDSRVGKDGRGWWRVIADFVLSRRKTKAAQKIERPFFCSGRFEISWVVSQIASGGWLDRATATFRAAINLLTLKPYQTRQRTMNIVSDKGMKRKTIPDPAL